MCWSTLPRACSFILLYSSSLLRIWSSAVFSLCLISASLFLTPVTSSCRELRSADAELSSVASFTCKHKTTSQYSYTSVGQTTNLSPPATDSGRTARTPLYPPVQAVPPLTPSPPLFPVPDRGTGKGWYLYPWQACATTACSECAC